MATPKGGPKKKTYLFSIGIGRVQRRPQFELVPSHPHLTRLGRKPALERQHDLLDPCRGICEPTHDRLRPPLLRVPARLLAPIRQMLLAIQLAVLPQDRAHPVM